MPVHFEVFPQFPLIYSRFVGSVSKEDVSARLAGTLPQADSFSELAEIIDLTDVTELAITPSLICAIADEIAWQHSEIGRLHKLCILRPASASCPGVDLLLELLAGHGQEMPIIVVTAPSDAVRELKLPAESLRLLPRHFMPPLHLV
ncbi:hypothetical protein BXY66_3841 [Shimia isoporae]|uniref:Uncharacterized protein n=1 Tax=Shimia isoporae TaxID=647720 RepID=A0A4R1N2A5_9RHOB|nr:hypothetical protein [Shimia isoporae]TCK99339.1 hypothetical protein BXY66_3841 [Shimia isoporae]